MNSKGANASQSARYDLNPAAACVAGMNAQEAGDIQGAVEHFERALMLAPALVDIRLLLAFALGAHGQAAYAGQVLSETPALETLPSSDLRRLADAAAQLGATAVALKTVRLLVQQEPADADLQSMLGTLLHRSGELEEAGHVLHRAVLRWPTHVPTLMNTARLLVADGNYAGALRNYDRALKVAPKHATARWHRGMLRLTMGDFAGGWSDHEARRTLPVHTVSVPAGIPAWDGKHIRGKTLLLWGEQGLGDQIQGVRFAAQLAALGARVVVRCAPPLKRLFAHVEGVSQVFGDGEALPACDAHVPMLSVPFLLKLFDEDAYRGSNYLFPFVNAALPRHSRFRSYTLDEHFCGARVGVAWAGSPGHTNDRLRSLPSSYLSALLEGASAQWISLQVGARSRDLSALPELVRSSVVDVSPVLLDFADTAHVIAALDRVITVDTSVAHLAGALGIPTLLLVPFVPDWRWQLVREDSPWYSSITIVRQPSVGDWGSVIARARRELSAGGTTRGSLPAVARVA